MKYKITILLLSVLILTTPNNTFALTKKDQLLRRIEIVKEEISLLQTLIKNFYARDHVAAASYLVKDLSTGEILAESNPENLHSIASITKMMTAIVAKEEVVSQKELILTSEMLRPYGSSPTLFPGAKLSLNDLIRASLIQSSNDAAEALSFFQDHDYFISRMNSKAKEIGMEKTIFYDAHGLNPANRSTASDLSKMIAYVSDHHKDLLEITRDNDFWLPDSQGRMLKFSNMNNFYYLSSFMGGKTGYLPEARQTLASVFEINEKPVVIIILNSDNRQADLFSIMRKLSK